jgi:hypothetical protein
MSSPKMKLLEILTTYIQIFGGRRPRLFQEDFLEDGEVFLRHSIQLVTSVRRSFRPSGGDFWPDDSNVRPGVKGQDILYHKSIPV